MRPNVSAGLQIYVGLPKDLCCNTSCRIYEHANKSEGKHEEKQKHPASTSSHGLPPMVQFRHRVGLPIPNDPVKKTLHRHAQKLGF